MNYKLILLEQGNIIVSDEMITDLRNHSGAWHIEKRNAINQFPNYLTDLGECELIIASDNPEHNLPSIDYNEREEEFGVVDVDLIIKGVCGYDKNVPLPEGDNEVEVARDAVSRFISISDKKFSLKDVEKAIDTYVRTGKGVIQSLQQPKVLDVEVEMFYDHEDHPELIGNPREEWCYPKITNNKIKIL